MSDSSGYSGHVHAHTDSVHIREAGASDSAAIAVIVNAAFQVEKEFRDGQRTSQAQVLTDMQRGTFLVASDGNAILGAVFVKVNGNKGYFGMLSVDPKLQRGGVGRSLLTAAEHFCRERGCEVMTLSTGSVRQELLPYYAKSGYLITKVEPAPSNAPFTRPIDIVHMEKKL
ncbi:MAG TPA: GNAT family N-acetyltransferase [Terriglobales bacterium]